MHGKTPDKTAPKYIIYTAFFLGLTTAVAFRAIIVVDHIWPEWVRPLWYFAVLGNFVFFLYRFHITEKRKHAIQRHDLIQKIQSRNNLSPEDHQTLLYLLNSIRKSPEHFNYLIISIFSLAAIGLDIILSMTQ